MIYHSYEVLLNGCRLCLRYFHIFIEVYKFIAIVYCRYYTAETIVILLKYNDGSESIEPNYVLYVFLSNPPSPHIFPILLDYNFSHRIDRFSYGDFVAGIVNPLDGEEKIAHDSELL